jgi:hypothetical protein
MPNTIDMRPKERKKWTDSDIVALVELDVRKMRVRLVLARQAIEERLRELEGPMGNPETPTRSV